MQHIAIDKKTWWDHPRKYFNCLKLDIKVFFIFVRLCYKNKLIYSTVWLYLIQCASQQFLTSHTIKNVDFYAWLTLSLKLSLGGHSPALHLRWFPFNFPSIPTTPHPFCLTPTLVVLFPNYIWCHLYCMFMYENDIYDHWNVSVKLLCV